MRILFERTSAALVLTTALMAASLFGCSPAESKKSSVTTAIGGIAGSERPNTPDKRQEERSIAKAPNRRLITFPKFFDVADGSGLQFIYENGACGNVLMIESTGGGAGWIDFDCDERLDLYLCQGGSPFETSSSTQPLDQLFRQVDNGRFEPISAQANVIEPGYSQGVAVADIDDDGFDDVYVTNYGPNSLFRNQGDGTFLEIARQAGVDDPLWGTSAAWGDLDGDGDLDLYVCNYVEYDIHHPAPCFRPDRSPATCHPKDMKAAPDECYFNRGDGTFTAEAANRGLFGPENKGLGVVIADLNNDGLPDVYVANDTSANFLFVNQGKGRFVESAKTMGCAVSHDGSPQASMGVALGDYDQNGWFDLYCTHFTRESNTLYKNLGRQGFQDVTGLVGLHSPTLKYLAFGTIMADFNQDGHEDIFITNGHIDDWTYQGDLYRMPPQLFSYEGPKFVECSTQCGDFFKQQLIGRGVARGDFDSDGDWDLAVVHQGSPTALLRNDSERGNWLKLRLIAQSNRRGVGSRVTLHQGAKTLTQEVIGGSSYCASHEHALIFGLGTDSIPCDLEIRWPDGATECVENVSTNQRLIVRQSGNMAVAHPM